jgi:hypothetical protein
VSTDGFRSLEHHVRQKSGEGDEGGYLGDAQGVAVVAGGVGAGLVGAARDVVDADREIVGARFPRPQPDPHQKPID